MVPTLNSLVGQLASIRNMAVYILYPTKRFVANVPPVNFFVRSFVCRSFVVRSPRSFCWREFFLFDGAKMFENKVWVDAIDFIQKSSKSELSSRFLSRSKFWGAKKIRNFERPFPPRGWLRSASNFVKMRFGRSPTLHFSMAKTSKKIYFLQNFEQPFTP